MARVLGLSKNRSFERNAVACTTKVSPRRMFQNSHLRVVLSFENPSFLGNVPNSMENWEYLVPFKAKYNNALGWNSYIDRIDPTKLPSTFYYYRLVIGCTKVTMGLARKSGILEPHAKEKTHFVRQISNRSELKYEGNQCIRSNMQPLRYVCRSLHYFIIRTVR